MPCSRQSEWHCCHSRGKWGRDRRSAFAKWVPCSMRLLSQRQKNDLVAQLVTRQAIETQFKAFNENPYRNPLSSKDHPAGIPPDGSPPRDNFKEIRVLSRKHSPLHRRLRQERLVIQESYSLFLGRGDIDTAATKGSGNSDRHVYIGKYRVGHPRGPSDRHSYPRNVVSKVHSAKPKAVAAGIPPTAPSHRSTTEHRRDGHGSMPRQRRLGPAQGLGAAGEVPRQSTPGSDVRLRYGPPYIWCSRCTSYREHRSRGADRYQQWPWRISSC